MSDDKDISFFSKSNDLRNRIIFTVLMLCVYRLGTYIFALSDFLTPPKIIMKSNVAQYNLGQQLKKRRRVGEFKWNTYCMKIVLKKIVVLTFS